ncbi:MAG: hypothetical protein KY475_21495 [Planctomycetes bacterium]|nr:hypothetical protein [Planctomycetota bacterium]
MAKNGNGVTTLERGNLYFFYRPRVGEEEPEGPDDVQRLYLVQSVHGEDRYRLMILGRKALPDPSESGGRRYWGFVDAVETDPKKIRDALGAEEYETKTRGRRKLPAARPAGEGIYRLVRHDDHTHLVYALELPEEPNEVQESFNIEEEASYIVSVKNPESGAPRGAGLSEERQAAYPQKLQEVFRGRRFSEVDPPDFLNHEGAEFVLVSAAEDVSKELGLELHPQTETESTAEIFNDLRIEKSKHPLTPLFEGEWN